MATLKIKLWKVYLPFVLLLASIMLLYNTGRWLLDIKLNVLPIKSELLDYWLPFIISWVLLYGCFKTRLTYLRGTGALQDDHFAYQFVCGFALFVPLMVSQTNLTSAPYSLINVAGAEDIQQYPYEKFFFIETFQTNRSTCLETRYTDSTSSRGGKTYYFHAFYSCPLRYAPNHWLSQMYYKIHDPKREELSLQQDRQQFYTKARDDFAAVDFSSASYFERLRPSNDLSEIQATISQHTGSTEKPVVLQIRSNAFAYRPGHDYFSTVYAVAIACLAVLLMVGVAKLAPQSAWPVKRKANKPQVKQSNAGAGNNKSWRRKRSGKKSRKSL